jgi:general secretion pathway protein C
LKPEDAVAVEEVKPPTLDLSNPLTAPDCGGIAVHAITESTDPEWSVAVLQATGEPLGKLRRVGDAVGDKQVAYIGYNTRKSSPAAWLVGGANLCQVLLFATQPEIPPVAAAAPPPPEAPKGPGVVPDDIARRIKKISDTEFQIDRAVVDNILEHQADLMRTARIVPEQKDGKVVGIRLFGIKPEQLLGKLGLQNGDRLEAINGFEMASPEKALEAYARLRSAESLSVKVTRRGNPVTIDFKIQ